MILFSMSHRCGSVRVGGNVVEFSGPLVRINTWHDVTSLKE